jgi:hypothetical protein
VAALAVNAVLAWAGRELFGLPGIALALAASTLLVLSDMLDTVSRRTAVLALAGLLRAGAIVGGAAALAFGAASLAAGGVPGALLGTALYGALLGLGWRLGLRQAWAYVSGLR